MTGPAVKDQMNVYANRASDRERKKRITVGEVNNGARAVEVGILVRKEWRGLPYIKSQHLPREHLPREIAFTRCARLLVTEHVSLAEPIAFVIPYISHLGHVQECLEPPRSHCDSIGFWQVWLLAYARRVTDSLQTMKESSTTTERDGFNYGEGITNEVSIQRAQILPPSLRQVGFNSKRILCGGAEVLQLEARSR